MRARAHICHRYHGFYPWRKNCHVEKFQLSIQNLNNLWSFIEVYAVFVPNLREEKSVRRKYVWRKNDKYKVWFETSLIAHPRSCLIGTSLPIDSRLTAKFPAILTHQSFHLTCFIEISEYVIFEDFSAFPCIFLQKTEGHLLLPDLRAVIALLFTQPRLLCLSHSILRACLMHFYLNFVLIVH